MNQDTYVNTLLDQLKPIYGIQESEAMGRILLDHLERKHRLPLDRTMEWSTELTNIATHLLDEIISGIPIQYVLKEAWFDDRCFFVDPSVLIPRPETEELLDWIRKDIGATAASLQIFEIGTGSGILAVSLKRAFKNAVVRAIDVSEPALNIARSNAVRFESEIAFQQIDFTDKKNWSAIESVDILVSNPPYIGLEEKNTLPKNVLEQEPWLALFVEGDDPLLFYRLIASFGKQKLSEQGKIFVEMHEDRADETQVLFESTGYVTEIRTDMQGKKRMLKAMHKP